MQSSETLDTAILSLRCLDDESAGGIGLYRRTATGPFTPRELRIANIILSEAAWLHEPNSSQASRQKIAKLFPRQMEVLDLLLQGHGRKLISQRLSISANTVSGYVKDIYKHFQVNSHAALIRRLHVEGGLTC